MAPLSLRGLLHHCALIGTTEHKRKRVGEKRAKGWIPAGQLGKRKGHRRGKPTRKRAQKKKKRRMKDKPQPLGAPGTAADDLEDDDSRGLHLGFSGPERQPKLGPGPREQEKEKKRKEQQKKQRTEDGRDSKSKGWPLSEANSLRGGGVRPQRGS